MTTAYAATSGQMKTERETTSNRIPAFDFTKGALVLFMVLFHWLNYFYGPHGEIYTYLRFLTPSFIFITGFLISHVHFAKYGIGSSKLSKRLLLRGLKLLILFIALNLIVGLLVPGSYLRTVFSQRSPLAILSAIFISGNTLGNGVGKVASFAILVPIGYLLILAALLIVASRFFKYTFHAVCGLLLLCMVLLDLYGIQSVNLELVTIGLLGVALGYVSETQIQTLVSFPWVLAAAYCAYLVAITIWDVSLYLQMVGACLTTTLIYIVGAKGGEPRRLRGHIELLGKYSLFAYVAQIAILQLLSASVRHINLGYFMLGASFVAGFALTMISVEAVDRARAISKTFDGVYRAVFA
jgi:peptidoglycan/LPS O-acetylase OafA/YrhL